MKKIIIVQILILELAMQVYAAPVRVLFIGNSYVTTNNLPLVFYNLALSAGDTIIYDSSAPGGYTFMQHCTYATTLQKITSNSWDYVILQEQSQKPSFPPAQVAAETYPYAAVLDSLIHVNDSCSQTMFYMTWGRKYGDATNCGIYPPLCTFEGMQLRLRQSYVEMADDNQAVVSPVGEAFKYSRMADSTINLYNSDNSHPSVAGTYLAACTFYATMFQQTPVGLSYTAGLSAPVANFLQQIAHQTVFDSLSVWNINEFNPYCNITQNTLGAGAIQFAANATNSSYYLWDFGDGNTSSLPNPLHQYAADGIYTVSLTVSDGCKTFNQAIQVVVNTVTNVISKLSSGDIQVNMHHGCINISGLSPQENYLFSINDIAGRVIETRQINAAEKFSIGVQDLPAGVYNVLLGNQFTQVGTKLSIIK